MAAAEARAAWQRTANRCFVQEDAKRAPKLACCSSSSSRSQSNAEAPCGPDHPVSNFMPLNWNTSQSNLPPDTKWWLQLQPNFTYQKDVGNEQMNVPDTELKSMSDEPAVPTPKCNVDSRVKLCKGEPPVWMPEGIPPLKATNCKLQQPCNGKTGIGEFHYLDEDLMDWEPIDLLFSNQSEKGFSAAESAWTGSEKVEPWWRTADKNELASLVAQKCLEHVENCDLPRPQKTNVSWGPFMGLESFNSDEIFCSSFDQKMSDGICNSVYYSELSTTSKIMNQKHLSCHEVVHSLKDSERPNSDVVDYCNISTDKDPVKNVYASERDPSKAELLEALRHSQTRAREAEKAAQQAYTEKEHIVKLFFRQASQLFACKQWLQLLQLETLYLQLKGKDHQISALFPVLPWMPPKLKLRKGGVKGTSRRVRPQKYGIGRYAVAFAVGLSLAGAGLLLGWTLGWLFPSF